MRMRLAVVVAFAVSWMLALGVRLYDLQVLHHEEYSQRAERQQQRIVRLDAPRGAIYDARGRTLAVSVEVESAAADPSKVEDPGATAAALAPALGRPVPELVRLLSSDRTFVWLARKLDPPRARAVRNLKLEGVFLLPESKRYYPLRTLAAQVLGYVGTDNVGLGGLESLYDHVIASRQGHRVVVQDGLDGKVLYPNLEVAHPEPGRDLHLSLDAAIQDIVERELAAAVERHNARSGTVVVMDPRAGAVLAMATYPTFDPNHFANFPEKSWRNSAVMDAHEPGSTFKMVTVAGALDVGIIDPLAVFDCQQGSIRVRKTTIHDHHPFTDLTVAEVMAKSSNVGAIKIGLALGGQRLRGVIDAFGFGRPTGIDLPGESAGIVQPEARWSELSTAYSSFGQSVSATPLQRTVAYGSIANGGALLRPYIVAAIGQPDGERERRGGRYPVAVPVSSTTVRQLQSMLEGVVREGTGQPASIPGYRVAGKTGTAQKAVPGRGYVAGRYIASFIGFAPADDPRLVCLVMIDEPWPLYHGNQAAAPSFATIVGQTLLYLGVRPESRPVPPSDERISIEGQTLQLASLEETEPTAAIPTLPGTVPDFSGLSARQAVHTAGRLALRPALHGHGFVARQTPEPGAPLEVAAGVVELWLDTAPAPNAMLRPTAEREDA